MPSNWRHLLDRVAPVLEGSLEGPFRGLAIQFLAKNLIDNPSEDPESDIQEFLMKNGDPSLFPKLRELDAEFKKTMQDNGISVNDLLDAEIEKEKREKTPAFLAGGITLGIFGMLILMIFFPVPKESNDIINIMLGALSSGWMSIVGYYFGSRHKKEDKS